MVEEFISEAIRPVREALDTSRMATGGGVETGTQLVLTTWWHGE